ncbi:MAG: hypothetical protein LLG44_06100 [Chloroflexi bacterium]|nr:hypothetical protein [Chloroflexota bacterium]
MLASDADQAILRALASEMADIAQDPVNAERIAGWKALNELRPGRTMVHIYQIPWHEMNVDDELTLRCAEDESRTIEQGMRRTLYQWRHMPGDMVVPGVYVNPYVIHDSGFGLDEDVDIVKTDEANDVVSRTYHRRIRDEADLELITTPEVTFDPAATVSNHAHLEAIFGDILPVISRGVGYLSYAPWDWLVRLWGVNEALTDLVERPALVHAAMERLTAAYLTWLDQMEDQNLLALSNANITGQGGLGHTDELPPAEHDAHNVRACDMWGGAMSQIFSAVSPAMHEEFALQYEARFLNRCGLCYYGCCDPLDRKVAILRRNLPRLRKISMSPWVDVARGAEAIGADYVYSYKPSPAMLAGDSFDAEYVKSELKRVLELTRGCRVELILKDISTMRYQPQRLWEWARIAREVVEEEAER